MKNRSLTFVLAFLAAGMAACEDSTGPDGGASIRPQLIRLQGAAQAPAAQASFAMQDQAVSGDYAWSSDIDIQSLETPIRAIWLEGDENTEMAMVYECEADSNDGCLVDLAGPALQDLLGASSVTIDAGSYDQVTVSTCEEEGGYTTYLTGSVNLNGRDMVTKESGVLGADGDAEAVALQFSGCTRSYPIPEPVMVADTLGEAIDFKLYFDIRDIAWASTGDANTNGGWIPGGCAGPQPGGNEPAPYLCVAYPDVAGVVDDQLPVIERYRINDGATLGLIFQASNGGFIGGFTRRYFQEDMMAEPGFTADVPVEGFVDNGDSTYRIFTFGGGGAVNGHYLDMEAFVRDSHSGVALDAGGNVFQYAAVRIE